MIILWLLYLFQPREWSIAEINTALKAKVSITRSFTWLQWPQASAGTATLLFVFLEVQCNPGNTVDKHLTFLNAKQLHGKCCYAFATASRGVCPKGLKQGSWEVWWGSGRHVEESPDNLGQKEPQHDPEFPGRWWGEWGSSQLITLLRTPPMLLPPTTSLHYLGILCGKTQSWHKCESRRGQNCGKCLLNLHCVKPPFKLLWQTYRSTWSAARPGALQEHW